jgi:universal stress protein E
MHAFDPVLVVVDPTADEQPAATKAARIARRAGARLHLLVCDYESAFEPDVFFRDSDRLRALRAELLATRKAELERLATKLRSIAPVVETTVRWARSLHRCILEVAAELEPGLIVKDTHYHSAARRSLFTNTDWHLIRDSRWPLLLVKPAAWHEEPRILAALDPSRHRGKPAELDVVILDSAERLRSCLDADVHVVHALNAAALLAATTSAEPLQAGPGTEIVDTERQRLEKLYSPLAAARGVPAARIHLEDGATVDVLLSLSESLAADIVVMGAISRSEVRERVLGSTAERTLDRLPCDVLVVKLPAQTAAVAADVSVQHGFTV